MYRLARGLHLICWTHVMSTPTVYSFISFRHSIAHQLLYSDTILSKMESIPATRLTQSMPHPFSPSSFLKPSSSSSVRKPFFPMCRDAPQVQRAVSELSKHTATAPAVQLGRRTLFLWGGALLLCNTSAASAAEPLTRYRDEADQFSMSVPSSWSCSGCDTGGGKGPTAARRTLAW